MIQFNLLPDVKLNYIKVQRTKRVVMTGAVLSIVFTFAIFLLLFIAVHAVQAKHMSDLNKDIKKYSNELKQTADLNKVLTIQNQLTALPKLHDDKVVASRLLPFVKQITPADVTISDLLVDFSTDIITVTGNAKGLDRVNTYTDTLKFTTYSADDVKNQKAFSDVVLSEFGRDEITANYVITAHFAPAIFAEGTTATLNVPAKVSTRSIVEQPTDIFKSSPSTSSAGTR